MAVKFDIKDQKLTVKPETLLIRAFNDIWKWDKSKTKEKALSLLKYVSFMHDITSDNPHVDDPAKDKEKLCKRDCWKDPNYKLSKEEQELYENAAAWYVELNKTLPWRSLRMIDDKIDQINDHLADKAITDQNFEDQMKAIERIDKLHQSREKVMEIVEKQLKKMRVRGGLERSPLEKGVLKIR